MGDHPWRCAVCVAEALRGAVQLSALDVLGIETRQPPGLVERHGQATYALFAEIIGDVSVIETTPRITATRISDAEINLVPEESTRVINVFQYGDLLWRIGYGRFLVTVQG